MATTALVMTTGDTGAYLCQVSPTDLTHLLRGEFETLHLPESMAAHVGVGADQDKPLNTAARRLFAALRISPVPRLHGPVVVVARNSRGRRRDLSKGMVELARRTLSPQDHVLPFTPEPLPRLHAAVRADDHEHVHELLREFGDGRFEVREAYGWFPHAFGLPSGPFASPTVEVTDLAGLADLVAQVDERTTTTRRVHGSDEVEDPWDLLTRRLVAHLLEHDHHQDEGRTVVVLTHLDPETGCPRDAGRPALILASYDTGHVRVELSGPEHLLPELRPGELALRRLARRGWTVSATEGSHVLVGEAPMLARHVARGVEALRDLFGVATPDHLTVTLHVGGRTVRTSDRLALLGAPRPLLLAPQRR
jgi:hypothetical protein